MNVRFFVAQYFTTVDMNDAELLHQAAAVWKASASLVNFQFRYFKFIVLVKDCCWSLVVEPVWRARKVSQFDI